MEVPIFIIIGPRRHPTNKRQLLVIEKGGLLSAKKGARYICRCEIIFGSGVGTER